jgi:transposase InsO family protein
MRHRFERGRGGRAERTETMPGKDGTPARVKWAQFRFSVVGPLLASPPGAGELRSELERLAAKRWRHPISGEPTRFGCSTIQKWYYQARRARRDPLEALSRKVRRDCGALRGMKPELVEKLFAQYKAYPSWSYKLHRDNLGVLVEQDPTLGPLPTYRTILRFMNSTGLVKRKRKGPAGSPGARRAERRFEHREVRSYQSEYVAGLWHTDFHHGSLRVLCGEGRWAYPVLCAVLDDRSRLCCHAQWYYDEDAESLVHTLAQAFLKRGLPRCLMSDNGSPMIAAETVEGLTRLGIVAENTLPYSPYQNGKQEAWWAQVEGRLLAMLEGVPDLTLARLNEATLAWIEMEYHRAVHSALGKSPLDCFLSDKSVAREAPSIDELRVAFTRLEMRTQRRSDGTVSLEGTRFEVPSRYGHIRRLHLRYASWDRSRAYVCDEKTGNVLCAIYPQDKLRNAEGARRVKSSPLGEAAASTPAGHAPAEMAPLMQKHLADYAATGLPAAYLPKDDLPGRKA